LCILASSSKSRSKFSDAGNTLTKKRSGLKLVTMNNLLFVRSNQDLMYADGLGMGTNSKENVGLWLVGLEWLQLGGWWPASVGSSERERDRESRKLEKPLFLCSFFSSTPLRGHGPQLQAHQGLHKSRLKKSSALTNYFHLEPRESPPLSTRLDPTQLRGS
jgi:hypothetical protein